MRRACRMSSCETCGSCGWYVGCICAIGIMVRLLGVTIGRGRRISALSVGLGRSMRCSSGEGMGMRASNFRDAGSSGPASR
ncbi:hypothetical protein FB45DRAFT_1064141, partial [Roridomyces roridus]